MPSNSYKVNGGNKLEDGPQYKSKEDTGAKEADSERKDSSGKENKAFSKSGDDPKVKNPKWKQNYVPTITEGKESLSSNGTKVNNTSSTSNGHSNGHLVRQVSEIFDEVFKAPRGNWATKGEFITSCMGMSVAFSGFWRFPFLIREYGGGAFLFAYILLFLLIGVPMFYMEAAVAQYAQLGTIHVWRCAPLMRGVGVGMVILSLITSIYNSQLVAYVVHYFFSSFINMDGLVVWGKCESGWDNCYGTDTERLCSSFNLTSDDPKECYSLLTSSSTYYWEKEIIHITELGSPIQTGTFYWDTSLCLLFVWFSVFVFLVQGIKSSGKVAYITGVIPFGILIAFLVVGCIAPGALKGLQAFYEPDWKALEYPVVWQNALEQVLFSLGISYGSIYMLSSYNKFKNSIHVDSVSLSLVNLIISVIAATTMFAYYGVLANKFDIDDPRTLMNVKVSGIELLFTFYPDVIARVLNMPHVYSIFFFFMLLCLGLHSQVVLVETCLTAVYDAVPNTRKRKYLATLCLVIPLFLLALPMCAFSTGLHIHKMIESAIIGPNVILLAIFELISLQLIYGVRRLGQDIKIMLGGEPFILWKILWAFVCPITLIVLLVFICIDWEMMVFGDKPRDDLLWVSIIRWTLTLLPLAMIPLTFCFTIIYKLCIKEPVFSSSPMWGPGCPDMKKEYIQATKAQNGHAKSRKDSKTSMK